ncbi:hypothetical protein G3M48_007544 [Beauveria asiatica]|uniref:C2H2-type domain-containing protein n=1 Tax=Beauveria asiatica TaxID=1069075 RepID=A0AAW0S4W3_9HYPO
MSTCGTCLRVFPAGWQSRQQHMNATGHYSPDFECDTCDRYFGSQHAVDQHMTDLGHWAESSEADEPDYECDDCNASFDDEEGLRDHEVKEHFYCDPCDRYFQSWSNINQHLHSKIHRNSSIRCFFCKTEHGTATGLVHHLEGGFCSKAPLSRDTLYEAVRRRDPDGIISKKLLTWTGSTSYEATEKAWNSAVDAYQCYLCARPFDAEFHHSQRTYAIPALQIFCEDVIEAMCNMSDRSCADAESAAVALSTALRELLKREQRARLHDVERVAINVD